MALRSVTINPKFVRFKTILKVNKSCALGYLEALWHFAGHFTPNGNLSKYSVEEIEGWLEWDGEEGQLIESLVKARWIDRLSNGGLIVHDWDQHCDTYTHTELAKKTELFACGAAPRLGDSFNKETKERIKAEYFKKYGRDVWETSQETAENQDSLPTSLDSVGESPDKSGQVNSIPEGRGQKPEDIKTDNSARDEFRGNWRPPTPLECAEIFQRLGCSDPREPEKFKNHYDSVNWRRSGTRIENFEAAAKGWIDQIESKKRESKLKPPKREKFQKFEKFEGDAGKSGWVNHLDQPIYLENPDDEEGYLIEESMAVMA